MKISETAFYGAALADTLSIADERILLTLGVRFQEIKSDNFDPTGAVTSSSNKSAVTPLAGLVVKPWQNISVYANRIEGLSKGDIAHRSQPMPARSSLLINRSRSRSASRSITAA